MENMRKRIKLCQQKLNRYQQSEIQKSKRNKNNKKKLKDIFWKQQILINLMMNIFFIDICFYNYLSSKI